MNELVKHRSSKIPKLAALTNTGIALILVLDCTLLDFSAPFVVIHGFSREPRFSLGRCFVECSCVNTMCTSFERIIGGSLQVDETIKHKKESRPAQFFLPVAIITFLCKK